MELITVVAIHNKYIAFSVRYAVLINVNYYLSINVSVFNFGWMVESEHNHRSRHTVRLADQDARVSNLTF